MFMTLDEELKELLENVQDVYEGFVICAMSFLKDYEKKKKMIDFIKKKKDVTTVDIINYTDELDGI